MNYKPLKLNLRGFLAGHTVAMVTYYVMKRTTTSSPIVGQLFDTMIVASSDRVAIRATLTKEQTLLFGTCADKSHPC